jgi:uncharacterized membrane protein HdeD (DUF308 family)
MSSTRNASVGQPGYPWGWSLAMGILSVVVGLLLLFDIRASVLTIVILTAFSLIVTGIGEIALSNDRTAGTWILGAVLTVGGVLALVWPGMTLWALALVAGSVLMFAGAARAVISVMARDEIGNWGWKLLGGIVEFSAGLLAVAWPAATVLVLAIVFGLRVLFSGVEELVLAKRLHDLNQLGPMTI